MSDDLISRSALLEKNQPVDFLFGHDEDAPYSGMAVAACDIEDAPAVDAVPVDEIKLLSITIDKATGTPETTIQIGERRFVLRTDPVDFVSVVRCKDCDVPHNKWTGCPNMNGLIPPQEHFCSYGERKENADM